MASQVNQDLEQKIIQCTYIHIRVASSKNRKHDINIFSQCTYPGFTTQSSHDKRLHDIDAPEIGITRTTRDPNASHVKYGFS